MTAKTAPANAAAPITAAVFLLRFFFTALQISMAQDVYKRQVHGGTRLAAAHHVIFRRTHDDRSAGLLYHLLAVARLCERCV